LELAAAFGATLHLARTAAADAFADNEGQARMIPW
jgi:hypothetical protein